MQRVETKTYPAVDKFECVGSCGAILIEEELLMGIDEWSLGRMREGVI